MPTTPCNSKASYGTLAYLTQRSVSPNHRHFATLFRGTLPHLHLETLLTGHDGCVNTVTWSSDGRCILSGSDDTNINIYQRPFGRDGAERIPFRVSQPQKGMALESGHTQNIFCVRTLSPQVDHGSKLISCAAEGEVRLHTLLLNSSQTGPSLSSRVVGRHGFRGAHRLATQPGGCIFASAGEDGVVRVYDARLPGATCCTSSFTVESQEGGRMRLFAIDFRPGAASELLSGGGDGVVRVWDLRYLRGAPKQFYPAHLSAHVKKRVMVTSAVFSKDGGRIACALNDEDTYVFNVEESSEGEEDLLGPALPWSTTAHWNSSVKMYGGAGKTKTPLDVGVEGQSAPPSSQSYHSYPLAHQAASSAPWGGITRLKGHRNMATIKGVAFFGPRCEYVIQGCDSGIVFVYDAYSGRVITRLLADTIGSVNAIAPHPDGETPIFATAGLEDSIKLWGFNGTDPREESDEEEDEEEKEDTKKEGEEDESSEDGDGEEEDLLSGEEEDEEEEGWDTSDSDDEEEEEEEEE